MFSVGVLHGALSAIVAITGATGVLLIVLGLFYDYGFDLTE